MGGAAAGARPRWRSDDASAGGPGWRAPGGTARSADGGGAVPAPRARSRRGDRRAASAGAHPQGHQTGAYPGGSGEWRGPPDRVRHCLTSAAPAPGSRSTRGDCRHAGVYGPRTDRADQPLDRCPQRPLRGGHHALPDAHRQFAIRRDRADGVGALPYCAPAGGAGRAASWGAGGPLGHRHEAARQNCGGALPDRHRPGARPPALPGPMGRQGPHRRLPARRRRHAGSVVDCGETIRESARGRCLTHGFRSGDHGRGAGTGAGFGLFRHR